ncbi:metallophosphoesterase [Pontibacter sp. BT310]|jgi:Icc-related predicted phosphoesterase|uniref:Metallophosphoesterase n=1 Tax=Pontibacter populi TaxID=890055 RepID=A0ABS6X676_9BACT|nr:MULTISPECIES: metallophosphoesterase [Pontibacter]MBJ6116642.1 metallophosphoesterase [Pontibacter sp. BT310]MBR0569066.1 metallophosphoesterase [Microvirga sp. STS03]MBW3363496.1 metallophosphoesterase [Pontibacter populi]
MDKKKKKTRVAAVGDIHVRDTDKGKWTEFFKDVSADADVLLICGDLTDHGRASEAEILAEELRACSIPVVAVLGNHDYDHNEHDEIRKVLAQTGVHMLDGDMVVLEGVGFAGVKGFGGGFNRAMLAMFGEPMMKSFVQEAVDESLKLDGALSRLETEHPDIPKIAVLHYAPIAATIEGEPEAIYPFLGSSRLAEPLERRQVLAAFHGHAHVGTLEGATAKGVKVFNVAKPLLQKLDKPLLYYVLEV